MHPATSWPDLADAVVGVWGLGVEGAASVRRLGVMGVTPILVDDHPTATAVDGLEVLPTDQGGLEALRRCDVVVKSPGISLYRPEVATLTDAGVLLRGGLGLWLESVDRTAVACITGTKGKSTTTALCVHLLNHLGHRAEAGGNIGVAPWDPDVGDHAGTWIIETSSFQVPSLTCGPPVVAVTSLSPDHLDWHGSVERYYTDKLSLCTKPGVGLALAEGTSPTLRAQRDQLGPHCEWVDTATGLLLPNLPGVHNARNAAMAQAVAVALGVVEAADDAVALEALQEFRGLPSRCQSLGQVGGVEFVDDSLSTNVLPAQAALAAFDTRPVALLVGGSDRGIDYGPLADSVAARRQPTLVVTLPDNGPTIGALIRARAAQVTVVDADDLDQAVALAFDWANEGSVVLLSPAAPSFGHFANYRVRGDAFAAAARRCGPLG
ncbi:MAG TPA: UDP-N-acetylmuramoyl-L-alanine--D-glutamate ligase [Acidimicrobiales bacterium]|jgi:UDP-N-acetylmuramoylalanine--D-glutamate ligase